MFIFYSKILHTHTNLHGYALNNKNFLYPHRKICALWSFVVYLINQCCGTGAGGAEIIWDLDPEPKLNF